MLFHDVASFELAHRHLAWPWVAIAPGGRAFAHAEREDRLAVRALGGAGLEVTLTVTVPEALALAREAAPTAPGLVAFAPSPDGGRLALLARGATGSVVVLFDAAGERARSSVAGRVTALTFDRTGARLWVARHTATTTDLVLLDATTLAEVGVVSGPPIPGDAVEELHVHAVDDAVLHVLAVADAGTFARVAGFAGGPPEAVPTALDAGGVPAGFLGFSRDGARAHFAEADELRTHAWPTLHELASVPFAPEFTSSYGGAILGDRIYVDGIDVDDEGDLVAMFDRSAITGGVLRPPFPLGMWAGRLTGDAIVTVETRRGEPTLGHVYRIPAPLS